MTYKTCSRVLDRLIYVVPVIRRCSDVNLGRVNLKNSRVSDLQFIIGIALSSWREISIEIVPIY